MNRPHIVVLVSAAVDGRVALGPHRTQWEEMADPRSAVSAGNQAFWSAIETRIDQLHKPQVKMQGSGSFVSNSKYGEGASILGE